MQIQVTTEELQKRKLFVGTPMYGGACHGMFSRSMIDLGVMCAKYGIVMQVHYLFNESLIQRARNYITDEFIRSDCTHMMFIDSDIGFNPNDVITMLALMSDESEYDVLTGPYPKKCISWEKIKQAVDQGIADEDPNTLENFVGDYVFNTAVPGPMYLDRPAEILEGGTGFMMMRRKAFDLFKAKFGKEYSYLPDHARSKNFAGDREIIAYFDCIIEPKTKRYLSEDYFFCQKIRESGGKVWLCPWMQLQHVGSYIFGGSLQALAQIGAAASVDPTKVKPK
jgi:hypothetical protein